MIPITPLFVGFLALYIAAFLFEFTITALHIRHTRKNKTVVPPVLKTDISAEELSVINQYTGLKTLLSAARSIASKTVFIMAVLFGLFPWWADTIAGLPFILGGLLFFFGPAMVGGILNLPFDYYSAFVIEERFGFNTKTATIWISDIVKSFLIIIVLGGALLSALLLTLLWFDTWWWLILWMIVLLFQLLLSLIFPLMIAPLFNRFSPIKDPELQTAITRLAQSQQINVTGIFQMDATRRTRHVNAYLAGIGKTKRIVLYDSLINTYSPDEITAILAHEIGHLKYHHIKKQIAFISLTTFGLLFLASRLLAWPDLYVSFGFSTQVDYIGVFLLGIIWEPVGTFLSPLGNAISRQFETAADDFAVTATGSKKPFVRALKKIAKDNLSNVNPHPAHVWLNASHPPITRRIERLTG